MQIVQNLTYWDYQATRVTMYRPFSKSYIVLVCAFLIFAIIKEINSDKLNNKIRGAKVLLNIEAELSEIFIILCTMNAPRAHSACMSPTSLANSILVPKTRKTKKENRWWFIVCNSVPKSLPPSHSMLKEVLVFIHTSYVFLILFMYLFIYFSF